MTAAKRLTQKQYAVRIKKSAQYVNKLVQRGVIKLHDRKIDPKEADAAVRAARQREERKPKPAKKPKSLRSLRGRDETNTTAYWQREHLRLKAESQRMENEQRRGELLPRDQVLKAQQMQNANFRTQLRRQPRSLAPLLSRMINASEIEAFLDDRFCQLLEAFSIDPLGERPVDPPVPDPVEVPAAPSTEEGEQSVELPLDAAAGEILAEGATA